MNIWFRTDCPIHTVHTIFDTTVQKEFRRFITGDNAGPVSHLLLKLPKYAGMSQCTPPANGEHVAVVSGTSPLPHRHHLPARPSAGVSGLGLMSRPGVCACDALPVLLLPTSAAVD